MTYFTLLAVDLSMFAIGNMLQTPPLSCEHALSYIRKTCVELSREYPALCDHLVRLQLWGLVKPDNRNISWLLFCAFVMSLMEWMKNNITASKVLWACYLKTPCTQHLAITTKRMTPLWHTAPYTHSNTHTLDHTHRVYYVNMWPHKHCSHSSLRNPGTISGNWPAPTQLTESTHWSGPQQCLVWARGTTGLYRAGIYHQTGTLSIHKDHIYTNRASPALTQSSTLRSSTGLETLQSFSSKKHFY